MKISVAKQLDKLKANKGFWLIAIVIVLIVAAVPSFYFYNQYKKTQELLQNPTKATDERTKALIDKVGKLIVLPTGEKPTVATVSDITKLTDQPFFQNAQNGDKVLIYTQAKEAILFRESIDKIIQVAPVSLGSTLSTNPAPSATATNAPAQVTVAIYNGTAVSGLAAKAESTITGAMSNAKVPTKGDTKGNYETTRVIDLSGNQSAAATQIANLLGGKVTNSLPTGETKPNTDILVILGADFGK